MSKLKTFGTEDVTLTAGHKIRIGTKKLIAGTKVIIDDILVWCLEKDLLLIYFECICAVFRKYRVSFRLEKCKFLKSRVEYVGHNILATGSCPALSKYNIIDTWPLPKSGQSLFSFIGLVNFYHRYAPYMEL